MRDVADTDPRVEAAARAEAEKRYIRQGMHVGTPQDRERAAFVDGALFGAALAAADAVTPTQGAAGVLRVAVGAVLWNVSNYPARAQARMLGQDTRPLTEKVTEAVLAALAARGLLVTDEHDREIAARALREEARRVDARADKVSVEHAEGLVAEAYLDGMHNALVQESSDLRVAADRIEAGDNAGRLFSTEPPTEVVP